MFRGVISKTLWEAISAFHQWERENIPEVESPQGVEILLWLAKQSLRPRSLKDLYRSSQLSEPTLRSCLKKFVKNGLATIEPLPGDSRVKILKATSDLEKLMLLYEEKFRNVASIAINND